MIRSVALLNLRQLARHPLRTILAVVAIGAGVSLLTAVMIVSESLSASVAHFYTGLSRVAVLRVVGADSQGGISATTVARIRATPGVSAAVPVVAAVTTIDRPGHAPLLVVGIGVDCRVQALIGSFGCSNSAVSSAGTSSAPFIAPSLLKWVGPDAVVHTDLNLISLSAAPTLPQLDSFNHGRVLVFPLPEAQAVFDRGSQVDDVFVRASPGVTTQVLQRRLQSAIGPQNPVVPADSEPAWTTAAWSGFVPLLGVLALFALVMGAILVASVLRLSLAERRRELAVASALGADRTRVIGGILLESLVMGVAGGVIGAVMGTVVARPLVGAISNLVVNAIGVDLVTTVRPAALLAAVGVAGLTAVVAALNPSRRATSFDLVAELSGRRQPEVESRSLLTRALAFTGLGLAGLALTWVSQLGGSLRGWQPLVGLPGIVLVAGGFLAAAAAWTPVTLRAVRRLPTGRGLLDVAVSNLASEPGRINGMAVAVALAVALGSGLAGMVPTLQSALSGTFGVIDAGRDYVTTVAVNNGSNTDSKLSPSELYGLAHLPGVSGVTGDYYLALDGIRNLNAVSAFAIPPGVVPFTRYSGPSPLSVLASGQAMVGAGLARSDDLHPGSSIEVPSSTGMVRLRVGGVWEDASDTGFDIAVSDHVLQRYWGPVPATDVYLTTAPGVTAAELARRVRATDLGPDVTVLSPRAFIRTFTSQVGQFVAPFWVIQRALMALALLATLSTLLLIGVQRRRELGLLGALGLGPEGLARMTMAEAGLVGLVASGLGVGVGIGLMVALRECAGYLFGLEPPLVLHGVFLPAALYCLISLVAVVLGSGWPAWRTSRLQITEALRYE